MAFTRVAMIPERDRTTSMLSKGVVTITHSDVYQVITDTQNYRGFQILSASGSDGHGDTVTMPIPGQLVSESPALVVQSVVPQRMQDPTQWEVEVNSTSIDLSQTGKWDIDISCDAVDGSENVNRYSDNSLIINSAGDVYPEGIPKEFHDRKYVVSFTTDSVEADALDAIIGRINSDAITMTVNGITKNFAAKTLKCNNAPWKTKYAATDDSYHQFSVSVELQYRSVMIGGEEVGWSQPIVDKGFRQIDDDGNVIVNAQGQACDNDGNAITSPIFLDGNGSQLDTSGGADAVFYPSAPNTTYDVGDFSAVLEGIG